MGTVSTESNQLSELAEGNYSDVAVYVPETLHGRLKSRLRNVFLHPSLVMNAASNWAATATNIIVGFLLTPFIIFYIGKSDYGILTLIFSIVGYYGILSLGVTSAITPYTARYIGQKDWQALNKFVNTALTFFTVIGLIALIASFVLAAPLASFFNISEDRFASFKYTIWFVGLAAALGFPQKILSSVIRGHENYVACNCIVITATLLRAALTVVLLLNGFGLLGAAFAVTASSMFSLGAEMILFRTLSENIKTRIFSISRRMMRILLLYGGTTAIIIVSDMVRFQIGAVVIGKFIGMEAVAVYAIAAMLMRYFRRGIRDAMKVLKPRFAVLYGSGQHEKLQYMLFHSTTLACVFSFGGATVLIVLGRNLINLWVGSAFADAVPVLYILVAALAFEMAQNPGINVLYALDKIRPLAVLWMAEAAINLLLCLLLVGPLGIFGVALGTAIPCFVFKLFILPLLVARAASISLTKYYLRILPPVLIAGVIVLLALLFVGL